MYPEKTTNPKDEKERKKNYRKHHMLYNMKQLLIKINTNFAYNYGIFLLYKLG